MSLFEPIFDALNNAGVRYIVVGGMASVLHGFARLTADIDLIVDLVPHEAAKATNVLGPFPFDELWARSDIIRLTTALVRVASIPDLIRMKRLVGRPQDLIDVEALENIQRRKARDGGR